MRRLEFFLSLILLLEGLGVMLFGTLYLLEPNQVIDWWLIIEGKVFIWLVLGYLKEVWY